MDGRLEWREWEATDGTGKREAVEMQVDNLQFLGSRETNNNSAGTGSVEQRTDVPVAPGGGEFQSAATGIPPSGNDEIPF